MTIEQDIAGIIEKAMEDLNRPDLYRKPLVAFADADDARFEELKSTIGDWVRTPREFLPSAQTVISFFVPFTREVPRDSSQQTPVSRLWGESYTVINEHFETVNSRLCEYLRGQGFEAEAVPATHTYNEIDLQSAWSHRSAAVIANLGYFSANRMVVTEKGSAGRYCTVFTSANIEARREEPKNRCGYLRNGSCGKCFKVCPAGALSPQGFKRFDCLAILKSNEKYLQEEKQLDGADVCGKCIAVCPLSYFE